MSSLKQWREALTFDADVESKQYYYAEMMNVLEAGEAESQALRDQLNEVLEALLELRSVAKEFLDASNDASKQMRTPEQVRATMQRWQNAGHKLRTLTKSVVLVRN